jgi:hypothetical protein
MTQVIIFVLVNGSLFFLGALGAWLLSKIDWNTPFNIIAWVFFAGGSSALMSPVVAAIGWSLNIPTPEVVLFFGSLAMVMALMFWFKAKASK